MEKLKPEKVVEMLKSEGIEVTPEKAASILDFLRKLAKIVVKQYLNRRKRSNEIEDNTP